MSGNLTVAQAENRREEIYTKHVNENIPINISEIETDKV